MKQPVGLFVSSISAVLIIFLCAPVSADDRQELAPLLFATQEFPPYAYTEHGRPAGTVVKAVLAACAEAGFPCSVAVYPWGRAQSKVRNGQADGLFPVVRTRSRDRWLRFSVPVSTVEYGFFVHENDPVQLVSAADMAGYRVSVYGPSNTSQTLEALNRNRMFTIDRQPASLTGFLKLEKGRVDAVFSNKAVGETLISLHNLRGLRYAGTAATTYYYVGFSRKTIQDPVLKRFNEALRSLPAHYGLPVPDPLRQDGEDAQPASAGAEEEAGNAAGE